MKKHLISFKIILNFLFSRIKTGARFFQYWLEDVTLLHGKVGAVMFEVELEEADGLVHYQLRDADGNWLQQSVSYRLYNRWLSRLRRLSPRIQWEIKMAAELQYNVKVQTIQWGTQAWNRVVTKPFDLSLLPSEEEVFAKFARRRKFHAWLEKHFPVKENEPAVSPRDIILR